MKRLTFILILITFFLIFSYSKPIVTGQAINEDYCDANNIFHLKQGGTNSCAEGCDDKKDCCGTLNDDCCTKENSDDAECGDNLICVDDFCKTSDDETLNEAQEKARIRTLRKIVCSEHNNNPEACGNDPYCIWQEAITGCQPKPAACIDNPNAPSKYKIPDPTNPNTKQAEFNYNLEKDLIISFEQNVFNSLLLMILGNSGEQSSEIDSTGHCAVTIFSHSQQICSNQGTGSASITRNVFGDFSVRIARGYDESKDAYIVGCTYIISCESINDRFYLTPEDNSWYIPETERWGYCDAVTSSQEFPVYKVENSQGELPTCEENKRFLLSIEGSESNSQCTQGPIKWYGLTIEKDSFGNSKISRLNDAFPVSEQEKDSLVNSFFDECFSHYGHEEPSEENKCGNGILDEEEECDNGMKCCNADGECGNVVQDCISDSDCVFVYKDLPSAEQYNKCVRGGGNGCSKYCQCLNYEEDDLTIFPPFQDDACLQKTKYLVTGKPSLPINMNYKCFPTANYNKDTGILICDTLVGYKGFPDSGTYFSSNPLPPFSTNYPESLKVKYYLRLKQTAESCFGQKVLVGESALQPKQRSYTEFSNLFNQPNFFIFGELMFYPSYTKDTFNSFFSDPLFRPFLPSNSLITGWTYGYGLYWAHQTTDVTKTSLYDSKKGKPEEASCFIEVYDDNNLVFSSGSNSKPCNNEPDITINPIILLDVNSASSASYLEITIKDDSSILTSVALDNLQEILDKTERGYSRLKFEDNEIKGIENGEKIVTGTVIQIPVNPKKFKQPRQITLTVKDNGLGPGGKNCEDISKISIVSQFVSLPIVQDSDFPSRRLMPIETFQFELKKLAFNRGGNSQTTIERFYDLDSDKLVGRATTILVEEFAQAIPIFGESVIRDSIGQGIASSYSVNLKESGEVSEPAIKEIKLATASRMKYQGNSIRTLVSDGNLRVVFSGKDSNGQSSNPITLGPYPLADQNKILQTPISKTEVLDYGQNGGTKKEFLLLKILSADSQPLAPLSGGSLSNDKATAMSRIAEVGQLYDKYIYNEANPTSTEAFFNRINQKYENIKQKIKE